MLNSRQRATIRPWLAVAMAAATAAEDVAVERAGRVSLSVDSPSVVEGGTAAWTVTASAEAKGISEDGQVLEVRVVSAGDWAQPSYDYGRVDQVVSFRRSDFARARRSAGRRGVFAGRHNPVDLATGRGWIATKSGTFRILGDGEVEQPETFLLTMSIAEGVGWASDAEEGIEVRIRDADAWGLALTASPRAVDEGETGELGADGAGPSGRRDRPAATDLRGAVPLPGAACGRRQRPAGRRLRVERLARWLARGRVQPGSVVDGAARRARRRRGRRGRDGALHAGGRRIPGRRADGSRVSSYLRW